MVRIHDFIFHLMVISAIGSLANCCQASHPNHASATELSWNSKTGNFEISLSVWPTDLEKVLTDQEGKSVDLDKTKDLDAMIQKYIESKFLIRRKVTKGSKPPAPPKIRWAGHEYNHKQVWLYFEVQTDDKTWGDWTIENRVFCELNDDQLNQVKLTVKNLGSQTILCTPDSTLQTLKPEKPSRRSLSSTQPAGVSKK